MNRLTLEIDDLKDLYRCYMPFIKGGAIFIKTNQPLKLGEEAHVVLTLPDALEAEMFSGEVVWINPQGAQNSNPTGVGVLLNNHENKLQLKIEKLLGPLLNSPEPTHTM